MPRLIPTAVFAFSVTMILIICWGYNFLAIAERLGVETDGLGFGDWGDSFGAFNAVFSAATLVGVLVTVKLQMELMRDQRASIGKEEFERIYFQIFSLIQTLKSKLRFEGRPELPKNSLPFSRVAANIKVMYGPPEETITTYHGDDAIKYAYTAIVQAFRSMRKDNDEYSWNDKIIFNILNRTMSERRHIEFSPYFRAIYTLLKRTDRCRFLNQEDKDDYSRLLRSQMSGHEAALLGLNGLLPASKDLKYYIVKYRMLKYCTPGPVGTYLKTKYPPEAFAGS